MITDNLEYKSAVEIASSIKNSDISPVEVVDFFLKRIKERNKEVNAFVTILEDESRRKAKKAEKAVKEGKKLGKLHGVPIAIKDLFDLKKGVKNTFGSKPLRNFVPKVSSTYVKRLEDAGAIILGKTNTPEFGHKAITDNLLFGPTSNPFDLKRNAGGSSGGSAAAVADGLVPIAQGSDAGGSIRVPASFCGVYGFKPSFGIVAQVSRPDAFHAHTPFIHAGPISRTVEDAALFLDVISGFHPRDPFSIPEEESNFLEATKRNKLKDLKIAYNQNFDVFPVESQVQKVIERAVDKFRNNGIKVREVELGIKNSQDELSKIWLRQMGMNYHSAVEGFKKKGIDLLKDHFDELTPELGDLLKRTRQLNVVDYKRDEHVRTEIYDAVQDVLDNHDFLITPTTAVPSIKNKLNGRTIGPTEVEGEKVNPLIGWCLTYPINFTGHPAASVPAGFTKNGLPVGMQVIGNRFSDKTLLSVSATFENIISWRDHYPPR